MLREELELPAIDVNMLQQELEVPANSTPRPHTQPSGHADFSTFSTPPR